LILLAGFRFGIAMRLLWFAKQSELGVRRAMQEAPPKAIFNLRGGIFRWHAEGRPLAFGPGASGVHPFSRDWGQLLKRLG
jgi:hypothetical protein